MLLIQVCGVVKQKAREGAQTRVAMLEVEMEAAARDLKLEKQRLEGARERIVLRYVPIVPSLSLGYSFSSHL